MNNVPPTITLPSYLLAAGILLLWTYALYHFLTSNEVLAIIAVAWASLQLAAFSMFQLVKLATLMHGETD